MSLMTSLVKDFQNIHLDSNSKSNAQGLSPSASSTLAQVSSLANDVEKSPMKVTAEPHISIETVLQSKQFQDWTASMDMKKFNIRSVHIQSVDMFGPKVGFIKFKADVVDDTGKFIPGICFMRGGSVGILPVLKCEGRSFAILTLQPRIATGQFDFAEIPAGMLDGSDNFIGVAAKELEEEVGLKVSKNDLTDLSALAKHPKGFYASPGGSEETIRLFSLTQEVTKEKLFALNGRLTGVLEEGEQITLKVVPLEDLLSIPDGKTLIAYLLYKKYVSNDEFVSKL
ncbi:MAG: NUDIX domain-containing protein [Verrucomicrobia bacterium]|nr:NUDIX domain-containing protein [Verrucomicrobiota bacterium]